VLGNLSAIEKVLSFSLETIGARISCNDLLQGKSFSVVHVDSFEKIIGPEVNS